MPRKLPWATPSATSKTRVKLNSRPAKRQRDNGESDDDFFSGTVLQSSGKGKGRADVPGSEDELPELPRSGLLSQTAKRERSERALSSSPPPRVSELPPPKIELMRKGVNKFDLRDDEWMLVEDEFLQTAELFTRHLHLREYERLKEIVQTKKDIVRPVVMSAKPSVERQMQMRAENKTESQKKALNDVFGSSGKGDIDDYLGEPKQAALPNGSSSSFTHFANKKFDKKRIAETDDTDSDDLDAVSKPTQPKRTTSDTPFVKPALPSKPRTSTSTSVTAPEKTPRKARESTFDFLDGYCPKPPSSPATAVPTSNLRSSSPTKPRVQFSQTSETSRVRPSSRPAPSIHSLFDDDDLPKRTPVSKEQTERLAKRQAERDKKREEAKRKSIGLNDIPTFLF